MIAAIRFLGWSSLSSCRSIWCKNIHWLVFETLRKRGGLVCQQAEEKRGGSLKAKWLRCSFVQSLLYAASYLVPLLFGAQQILRSPCCTPLATCFSALLFVDRFIDLHAPPLIYLDRCCNYNCSIILLCLLVQEWRWKCLQFVNIPAKFSSILHDACESGYY